jgi:hypothetical protein
LPAVQTFGEPQKPLEFDEFDEESDDKSNKEAHEEEDAEPKSKNKTEPPATDEFQWQWKVSSYGSILFSKRNRFLNCFFFSLSWKLQDVHSFYSIIASGIRA